ncbi:MAG: radical SAM family heme chaperone HemW [Candidatus Cardinium sp.]|uniref:radical SAM family heme chaperone HemW n=1 Tax=Cardinium endosymbiont of Dermatophagoides farinae TaxID=2597823 RepID=UPI001183466E|nr:radical SAM family heme chaperone HemW [Cardinium endosymbiont of Dermatophagoides farinae]TSJ81023.1 radical SAM family heme chaperone HemW [Cardinium endosymbiont of Dermatophagoides farinae]UWW97052.1 MAG: radical SAM family heme chaperone HemW [Candidatus Cardinium sp.]
MLYKNLSIFNPTQGHAGIYLHIPFCKQACHYCAFHFSTNLRLKSLVLDSMLKEIALRQDYLKGLPITSIYFGGGTPSLLTLGEIERLLDQVVQYFPIAPGVEITLEANPDDVTLEKLQGLRHMGVNRLSIGIQSFNDRLLGYMNRAHTSVMAQNSVAWARAAGFDNLNIDLIYAIPGTTTRDWQADLTQALWLEPEHIAAYCLTIKPKTVFDHWHQQGRIVEVDETLAAEQFELAIATCSKQSYLHYEISNFCKPEKYSRHNTNYWKAGPYIGIGPGAHAYNGLQRQWNISHNALYSKAIQNGKLPYTAETLTLANHVNEYIMTSIRTCWGCDLDWIYKQYAIDLMVTQKDYLEKIILWKLAYLTGHTLYLTNSGKLLADKIASDLFVDG